MIDRKETKKKKRESARKKVKDVKRFSFLFLQMLTSLLFVVGCVDLGYQLYEYIKKKKSERRRDLFSCNGYVRINDSLSILVTSPVYFIGLD